MQGKFKILYGEKRKFITYVDSIRDGNKYKKNYDGRKNPLLMDIVPVKNIINPFPKLVKRRAS